MGLFFSALGLTPRLLYRLTSWSATELTSLAPCFGLVWFWDRVLLSCSGWHWTPGLKQSSCFSILKPLNCSCKPPHPASDSPQGLFRIDSSLKCRNNSLYYIAVGLVAHSQDLGVKSFIVSISHYIHTFSGLSQWYFLIFILYFSKFID